MCCVFNIFGILIRYFCKPFLMIATGQHFPVVLFIMLFIVEFQL